MNRNANERPLDVLELIDFHGNLATVKCASALPPGSRVCFDLEDIAKEDKVNTLSCNGKIVNLKKKSDGTFVITIRLHTFSKALQEALRQLARRR